LQAPAIQQVNAQPAVHVPHAAIVPKLVASAACVGKPTIKNHPMKLHFIVVTIVALPVFCWAQNTQTNDSYSVFFQFDKGVRADYEKNKSSATFQEDTITKTAILHILIPQNQNKAQISLSYGKGANGREDDSWEGVVIRRTPDMITILCSFGEDRDKFINYVIYPKQGVGFSITYSAYLGSDVVGRASGDFPFGSALIIPFKKLNH